jgi:hypothetical protein
MEVGPIPHIQTREHEGFYVIEGQITSKACQALTTTRGKAAASIWLRLFGLCVILSALARAISANAPDPPVNTET